VAYIETYILYTYKHNSGGTSKDEMSFSTIIDTVLVTYKTTGNVVSVGLDSSSILDFAMDLCDSSLIQLSVCLSTGHHLVLQTAVETCSRHNTVALHSNGLATHLTLLIQSLLNREECGRNIPS
jgi:hypothetical protein